MIAEGLSLVRGLCLEVKSEPCQQQRQRIGKIVAGVGKKRQAVCSNSSDELDNDEHRGGHHRPPQGVSCGGLWWPPRCSSLSSSSLEFEHTAWRFFPTPATILPMRWRCCWHGSDFTSRQSPRTRLRPSAIIARACSPPFSTR